MQRVYFKKSRLYLGKIIMFVFAGGFLAACALDVRGADFSDLFVDSAWLRGNQPSVTIVDARAEKDFKKGHIPGAISAPWQFFAHMEGKPGEPGWGNLLPPEELRAKLSSLGIDGSKPIVVYAYLPGWGEDGRFAWMVKMLGITDVKLLDGGYSAWKRDGGVTTREKTVIQPGQPLQSQWDGELVADTDWILSRTGQIRIVDSRAAREFSGATPYGEARGGHLPGAVSIPFKDLFNADGRIKNKEQLQSLFETAGLNPESEIVIYCTAGIRSAYMVLVMRMMGFSKARNYDASFYEWAAMNHLPVE